MVLTCSRTNEFPAARDCRHVDDCVLCLKSALHLVGDRKSKLS